MKRSTSFVAVALTAMALAAPAQAQMVFDWDENDQFTFYPEDLVCEGGVTYDEDLGAFVFDGTPGKIKINIPEDQTFDWTEVARIEVHGTLADENGEDHELTYYAWNGWDPLATFTVYDRDILNPDGENIVNSWMGSRYAINYGQVGDKEYHNGKTYAALSAHVTEASWATRNNEDEEGNVTTPTGEIYIDEIVFTKSIEQDPQAITADMWKEWDNFDETANEIAVASGIVVNLNTSLGGGAVFAGPGAGVVPGNIYADLTQYAGIYVKGTPGTPWRALFNRQSMEDGGDYVNFVKEIPEDGELYIMFTDEDFLGAFDGVGITSDYIHLNSSKINWGAPEGAKITKFNFVEAGENGINDIIVDNVKDNAIFNIYGQKVNESYKGLVIKNGKKYINK